MADKSIYGFDGLKNFLAELNIHVGAAVTWRQIEGEDIHLDKGDLDFTDEGIFSIDENGIKRQVFLYKREYNIAKFKKPRMHICKCKTIDDFLEKGGTRIPDYRRANTETVKVIDTSDRDDMQEVEVSELPLCSYCAEIMFDDKKYSLNSAEFSEILKDASEVGVDDFNSHIDYRGYTRDWREISRRVRQEKNYTCEKCGVKTEEHMFMHVHHINGVKTDNSNGNLQCLCVRCHSEVDDTHRANFSSLHQKLIIRDFKRKYGGSDVIYVNP